MWKDVLISLLHLRHIWKVFNDQWYQVDDWQDQVSDDDNENDTMKT